MEGGGTGANAALGAGASQKRKLSQLEAETTSVACSTASGSASACGNNVDEGVKPDGSFRDTRQQQPLQRADGDKGLGSLGGSGGCPRPIVAEHWSELIQQRLDFLEEKERMQNKKLACFKQRLEHLEEEVRVLEEWLMRVLQERSYFALKARQKKTMDGEQHKHELELDDDDTYGRQWPRNYDEDQSSELEEEPVRMTRKRRKAKREGEEN
jgi:hypothetical protein